MIPHIRSSIVTPTLLIGLLVLSLVLARRPYYNWDMFPYLAIVIAQPGLPFDSTHREVYRAARAELPVQDFQAISSRQPKLMEDPAAFLEIMKYFSIKPGYTWLARGFYHLGAKPVMSTWLPSVISYFLVGVLVYFQARRHAPPMPSALFVMIIALSPQFLNLARYSSPDMLCALVSTAGTILVLRSLTIPGLALLTMAVWIRPDSAIFLMLTVGILWIMKQITWYQGTVLVLVTAASLWLLLGNSSLINEYLLLDYSLSDHWAAFRTGLGSLFQSLTLPMIALALGMIYFRQSYAIDLRTWLLAAAVGTLLLRYFLHPFTEDRFNLPAYLLISLVAWETMAQRHYGEVSATKS